MGSVAVDIGNIEKLDSIALVTKKGKGLITLIIELAGLIIEYVDLIVLVFSYL